MTPGEDACYLRYVTARLGACPNVWWSLANEYDLLWSKGADHWERSAAVVRDHEPFPHLMSNHNWVELFDNDAAFITHASLQRGTTEQVGEWRERWGKPVIVDELGYEGDLEWGWGNRTAPELLRRCWEAVVRGGYATHGECFFAEDEVIWWAKGGELKGESTPRMAFLRTILEQTPGGAAGLDPLPSDFDVPLAGVPDRYILAYFGNSQPGRRTFALPPGIRFRAEVIDTWNMTVTGIPGAVEGTVTLPLPARPYLAVRLRALEGQAGVEASTPW